MCPVVAMFERTTSGARSTDRQKRQGEPLTNELNDPRPVIAGVFDDQEAAGRAFKALVEAHFEPKDDISVVLTDKWGEDREDVPLKDELETYQGAEIGGAAGVVLGAAGGGLVAAGLLTGPAALVAAGPVVAALQGAYAGGAFGVVAGWLVGLGIMKEEADFHATHLEAGKVWVGVHATDERLEKAREILDAAGAVRFESELPSTEE